MQQSMTIKRKIPNCLTSLRIAGAISLLFTKLFSTWFFVIYSLCGLTDVLDGFLARKWRAASRLGSVLDTVADFAFYAAMIRFIAPYLWSFLPVPFWIAVAAVLIGRIIFYAFFAIKFEKFSASHTYLNKITSFLLFTVPYFVYFTPPIYICSVVCVFAVLSCAEEFALAATAKSACQDRKSIFIKAEDSEQNCCPEPEAQKADKTN